MLKKVLKLCGLAVFIESAIPRLNSAFDATLVMRKSSLNIALALLVVSMAACGGYGKQPSPVAPNSLQSITIAPAIAPLELGANQQFTATGKLTDGTTQDLTESVSWSTSDQAVLRVNTTAGRVGLANTRGAGSASISAAVGGIVGSASVTRRPRPYGLVRKS